MPNPELERRADLVVVTPPRFEAKEDHVVAVLPIDGFGTFGMRFQSPEQLMEFFTRLLECAAEVWPDHPIVKMFEEE